MSALEISDQFGDSVVKVVVDGSGVSASGSGVAIDAELVVTAAHVVDNTNHPTVQLRSGAAVVGTVIGRDENWDVAVIQLPPSFLTVTLG